MSNDYNQEREVYSAELELRLITIIREAQDYFGDEKTLEMIGEMITGQYENK